MNRSNPSSEYPSSKLSALRSESDVLFDLLPRKFNDISKYIELYIEHRNIRRRYFRYSNFCGHQKRQIYAVARAARVSLASKRDALPAAIAIIPDVRARALAHKSIGAHPFLRLSINDWSRSYPGWPIAAVRRGVTWRAPRFSACQ